MRPEQQIQQASRPTRHAEMTRRAPIRLDDVAARRIAVQRTDAERGSRLSAALQYSHAAWDATRFALAAGENAAAESDPSDQALGGPNVLARTPAGRLGEWREAA